MKHDIQLYHDTRRPCKKGGSDNKRVSVYPLKIRVGGMGRNGGAPFAMGINVSIDQYADMCAKRTQAKHRDLWNEIEARLNHADKIVDGMMPFFNTKVFKERFKKRSDLKVVVDKTSLQNVLNLVVKNYLASDQFPMSVAVTASVKGIMKFVNREIRERRKKGEDIELMEDIPMRAITPEFCRQYEAWMVGKSKTQTCNGASINMRHIRILFNEAIENDILPKEWYPFKRESGTKSEFPDPYVIPSEEKVKTFLDEDETIELAEIKEFETDSDRRAYMAYFCSFYCNGCNPADYLRFKFKDIDGKYINFYREKIKNARKRRRKPVKVYLSDELREFIRRFGNKPAAENYIFPILQPGMTEHEIYWARRSFTSQATKGLKRLLAKFGFEKNVSIGKARHALANMLRKKGVSRELFKEIFGHTSIITADNYYDQFNDDVYEDLFNKQMRLKPTRAVQSVA